jgi:heterodisulfide reductase subunit B
MIMTKDSNAYAYFPGCSLEATNRAYDISTRSVAQCLGITLEELADWNCCGATAYMAINEKLSFALSARNLAIAEAQGQGRHLVTACSGCYLVLHKTNKYMQENPTLRSEIEAMLTAGGMQYNGSVKVRHILDVIVSDLCESVVRDHVSKALQGLRVAPYYGCQISRPFGDIDDPEDPQMMDQLVQWLGAENVDFPVKAKCCGGMMMTTNAETGMALSGKILKCAVDQGADCIVTACPLCQINLEAYQDIVSRKVDADCRIPVLYFTQLMGVAFGLNEADLALNDSLTPVQAMLTEKVGSL